ncbi:RNA 2',3'-cyclic phosphodiesterase [bacterium]|nr:RNA 2',3'-cyclic phosphodiesterase [bacterium]
MNKKRIFIASPIPPKIKEAILNLKNKEPFSRINCRFTRKENLHITILFLGYLDIKKIPLLSKKVHQVAEKFLNEKNREVFLNKVCFGPFFKLRMIWVTGESKILENLSKELKKEFEKNQIPFKNKEREFLLHITIARFQKGVVLPKELKNFSLKVGWKFSLKKIQIMESILKPKKQPEYITLEEISLI